MSRRMPDLCGVLFESYKAFDFLLSTDVWLVYEVCK